MIPVSKKLLTLISFDITETKSKYVKIKLELTDTFVKSTSSIIQGGYI